jgi:hypothetical protein
MSPPFNLGTNPSSSILSKKHRKANGKKNSFNKFCSVELRRLIGSELIAPEMKSTKNLASFGDRGIRSFIRSKMHMDRWNTADIRPNAKPNLGAAFLKAYRTLETLRVLKAMKKTFRATPRRKFLIKASLRFNRQFRLYKLAQHTLPSLFI